MARKYIQNCTGASCGDQKSKLGGRRFSKFLFYFLLICFCAVTGYVFFFSPYLQITSIEITGSEEPKSQELNAILEQELNEKYIGLISKNNFLFLGKKKIAEKYQESFKKIRKVEVEKTFPNKIAIKIEERKALLVWCNDRCFLIDEKGVPYAEADFASPQLTQNHLLQIQDQSNEKVELGQPLVEAQFLEYLLKLKDEVKDIGFEMEGSYWTPSRMSQEIDLKTQQGLELYFSTQYPLETATGALALLMKKELSSDIVKELAYIDLRSEGKVFYKAKSAQPAAEEKTAQAQGQ